MRQDNYVTRLHTKGKFIKRIEAVGYERPMFLSHRQYTDYCANGFLVMPGFFDEKIINEALKKSENVNGFVTNEPVGRAIRAKTGIHDQYPFSYIIKNEKLISIVKSILGSEVYIHQSRINYKSPISSTGWHWHSDFETWHAQDGMPYMRCLSAMIPLTKNTECNGSLMLIPKSHKLFYGCKKENSVSAEDNFANQKEGVPDTAAIKKFFNHSKNEIKMALCNPGDIVLFDCNTIHVSNPNMTSLPRTNLFAVYNSIENKLQKPFSSNYHRPESMGTTKIKEIL